MTCGACRRNHHGGPGDPCPHCGAIPPPGEPQFIKTSTILVSKTGGGGVYRDLQEMPAPLRSELLRTTHGENSAIILIADRRGRGEIARALQSIPAKAAERRNWFWRGAGVLLLLLALLLSLAVFTLR